MGNSSSRCKPQAVQPSMAGAPTVSDLEECVSKSSFTDLPPRGQEAFMTFLQEEDKNNAKSYQFWLKSHKMELGNLLDLYICDCETSIKQVDTFFMTFKNRQDVKDKSERDFLNEKKSSAKNLDKFLEDLRDIIKPDLDESFKEFISYLSKKLDDN